MATTLDGAIYFTGAVQFGSTITLPSGSIGNSQIASSAAIDATKLQHQYAKQFAQVHGTAATAERRVIHRAKGAGTLTEFKAGPVVAATGDSTVTVDLRKNGTTVLSGTISITSGTAAFAVVTGSISSASYSAGDVFEVVQTVSAGTGTLPQGVFAEAVFREDA